MGGWVAAYQAKCRLGHEFDGFVQLINNLDEVLTDLGRVGDTLQKQATNLVVQQLALLLGDQRVGGGLYSCMEELVRGCRGLNDQVATISQRESERASDE